jgi:hypothetical protein
MNHMPPRRNLRLPAALGLISALAAFSSGAQNSPPVVFPTDGNCSQGLVALPSRGGYVYFNSGVFFDYNGTPTLTTCWVSNFIAIQFSPAATEVAFNIINFAPGNVITVETPSGPLTYTLPISATQAVDVVAPNITGMNIQSTSSYLGNFAIFGMRVTQPPPSASDFRVQNLTANGSSPAVRAATSGLVATIPLGTRFTLTLQDHLSSGAIKSSYALGQASLSNAQIDPSLYPHDALLVFNANESEATKTLQAMHLGTQLVVATPDDSSIPRQTITVKVIRPDHVGSTHGSITLDGSTFDLDAKIIDWADRRGVPPQIIKGIIDRETGSKYLPLEWRYEPLVTDWDEFSPLGRTDSLGQYGRAKPEYAPYRMEYDTADPRGHLLVDAEDVHPRAVLYLDHAANTRISDAEPMVTAYTIVSQNDFWQNWIKNLASQAKKARLTSDKIAQTLSWTAQTTLASSYGLMQVLFPEQFGEGNQSFGYSGIDGKRRPYYLFDAPANIGPGGGSIPTGSGLFVFKYRWETNLNETSEYSPQYKSPSDLDADYVKGLKGYNGSVYCNSGTCYGADTLRRSQNYLPISTTSIFP